MIPLTAHHEKTLKVAGFPPGTLISIHCLQKEIWKQILKRKALPPEPPEGCKHCLVLKQYRKAYGVLSVVQNALDDLKLTKIV